MSEEAKTSEVNVAMPMSDVHADTQPKVSKFDQSKNPIPKVVPPRGSKDARSFRPSTLAEINMMNRYEPLEMKMCGKTYGIGCGNSLEDVLLISGCILALWSFILGVSGLLLKSAIDTDRYATTSPFFSLGFREGVVGVSKKVAAGRWLLSCTLPSCVRFCITEHEGWWLFVSCVVPSCTPPDFPRTRGPKKKVFRARRSSLSSSI